MHPKIAANFGLRGLRDRTLENSELLVQEHGEDADC